MRRVLVADPHFDDNPANDYRWTLFPDLFAARPDQVIILGDLCHKKDRHTSVLVNRLIDELRSISSNGIPITVLMGNHDRALKGPAYWEFLTYLDLWFVSEPTEYDGALWLPHSKDPATEWAQFDFTQYKCLLMHQPADGLDLGNGTRLVVPSMLYPPLHVPAYSGDAHYPQNIGGIEYIGSPHPINFGEQHKYRMIVLDEDWKWIEDIERFPMLKHSITVSCIEDLEDCTIAKGDQAKIEFVLPASRADQWPIEREAIAQWAADKGVVVSALKTVVETSPDTEIAQTSGFMLQPIDVLVDFAQAEGIEDALLATGYNLLQEALTEGME